MCVLFRSLRSFFFWYSADLRNRFGTHNAYDRGVKAEILSFVLLDTLLLWGLIGSKGTATPRGGRRGTRKRFLRKFLTKADPQDGHLWIIALTHPFMPISTLFCTEKLKFLFIQIEMEFLLYLIKLK